ncbi:autotransporter-associated beta strand repeat-containing protein [Rhodanobacter sp. Col0626]|uniref:autotransporter-associated beta strand repeat-containing protein n=1 Tax=Rhodanobacter sp. Col0626 TaxID=3415679 RepID=UPI003CF72DA4
MNRVFRIVWSTALNTWVVASELAGKHGKGRGRPSAMSCDERPALRLASAGWTLRLGLLAAMSVLYAPTAFSTDLYWDVNSGTAGSGGTGTWNITSPLWNSASDGVAGPFVTWDNAAFDNAVFAGTAGTVTLGAPITVQNLTFGVSGFTLTGGTLTLGGTTPTITNNGTAATIDSIIAGNQGLTKTGSGQLILSGTNIFTGGVNVQAGTLTLATDAALGTSGNGLTMAAGTALTATTGLAATRVVTLTSGSITLRGAGAARFTGAGGIAAASGVTMSNAADDYTGRTIFAGGGTYGFTSVGNLGQASALGAPTDPLNGLITVQAGGGLGGTLNYTGTGDTSNRDWQFQNTSSGGNSLRNLGTGTLTLTGNISNTNPWLLTMGFSAQTADMALLGVISSASDQAFSYAGTAGRTITLGGANTYTGASSINAITVVAPVLAATGSNSSFGTGTAGGISLTNGTLSYVGGAVTTDRAFNVAGASAIDNDGAGALALTGTVATAATNAVLTLGGSSAGANSLSGIVSGPGSVTMNGAGSWELDGDNTYTGTTTVQGGTLIAGTDQALGATKAVVVNGGTLDLNDQNIIVPSLAGTGGSVDLGSGTLTLKSGTGSTTYAGSIIGTGGLTKLGASTQTLTGANTYSGDTLVGGGTLALNFAAAGAPASNIINSASALNLNGGTLVITGGAATNSQSFSGLDVTAGSNRINTTAASGHTLNVGLGAINRSGGLVDFDFNTGSTITTTHADGALGGWATVNGTDYAQVTGGVITAFTDYADKDNAATWMNGDIVSDEGGAANTPYTGTVNGNVALGGLKYTAAANSTVTVGAANTLSVDGNIIVSPSANGAAQNIQGGSITGGVGGSPLGVLQNNTGNFFITSTIVDNGGATSFVSGGSGTGTVQLRGANTYTGGTTISGGTLYINSIANGGVASAIGASSADPSNLAIENGTLHYVGATASTDRGFTLVNGGPSRTIQVDSPTTLSFSGQVTSPDDAGFNKTGAGTLALTNPGNDFVGPVVVSGGLLSVATLADGGQVSSLGAATSDSSNLQLTGGGLEYTGGTVDIDRGFTLAGGPGHIAVDQAGTTLTDDGTVVGGGSLIKDGAGTLVLTGTNTYTGGNTVTAGTLQAGSAQAFGGTATGAGAGQLTVNAGATADLNGFAVWVTGLNGAGNVTLGNTGVLQLRGTGTFSGNISGAGGVSALSGTNQTFSGCGNSYTGATIIASATVTTDCLANGGQNSGIGASTSDPANLAFTNGTLVYTGATVSIDRGIQLTGGAGGLNIANAATTLTIGGSIQGAGNLTKQGAGTLVLTNSNTYTGGTTLSAGTLQAGATNAFGTGYINYFDVAGAQLDLNGFNTSASYITGGGSTGGNTDLGGATLTINSGANSAAAANYGGTITGTGNVVKNGGSFEYLSSAASNYVGTTTANAGILEVAKLSNGGAASSIGSSNNAAANLVLNGGTFEYVGSGDSTDRLFTLGASNRSALNASGTGAVQFTNTGAIAFSTPNTAQTVTLTGTSADNNSLAAQITDNGTGKTSLSKTGVGTWILRNAASNYTGVTTISGGVLGVDHLTNGGQASSIGSSSNAATNLVIGNGATLRYTGTGDTTDRLFTLSGGTSVIESSGTGAIDFANTGSAAYAGSGNRTLGLGGTNTDDNTMGGTIIDGPGGITTLAKNDAGTWLLTGTNTYTGNTVVNDGLLQIGNGGTSGSIASATMIVDTNGTLGFDRSDTMTLDGVISGAGKVQQSGTGTTVLTATETYTGGTTIAAGTLQLGNGGANGSILGNVIDNGTLTFDRSDVYTFGGLISGTGGLVQNGTGTTVLTGTNTYKGATTVSAGTLLIDGDESAVSGLGTSVLSGATLGGTGIIGSNVRINNGGIFSPGDTGAAGTLTLNGNLAAAPGAIFNYQFGQPNVVGGTLNDLTVVHGNLDLNGTLNVSATPGGSFGPGLYRIISYDGTLSGNGLTLGTTPAGTYQVQTSVANQVNLLNSNGLTLNFWDGPNGHGNNTIDGGAGVWQNSTGNSNWADQTGQYNAPYTDSEFAIFMGTPGAVTVDNSLGAVTSSGMQFAVDGYTVTGTGAGITLASGQDVIRVGDGTAAGANMTATINAPLNGAGSLVKEDLGTLVLTGSINNYTGGTAINGGVLQASSNTALGNLTGTLSFDGGTLRTGGGNFVTARSITLNQGGGTIDTSVIMIASGAISGAGALTKIGTGSLLLSGTNTYAGGTFINGGIVNVNNDTNLGNASGAVSINGGTLRNTGALTSARGITLGSGGGTFDTTVDATLTGTIAGAGALSKIDGGTLILSADNTYGGGTTISGGVLQLGNGGTTGSIIGNVVNNGTLVSDRSDAFNLAGLISGSGTLEQQGTGTTVLSGNNTYAGGTNVRAGSLIINGDQSAATGTTSIDSGGTLGGMGTIGGDVNVADGGSLNPGNAGSAPGTLSIKGSLALSDASSLNVDMGQANVVGGPLNDLVQVGGDLTLDGTLNVSVSSGGSFDPGIYRVIGYNGNLTDNGINLGSVPSPDFFLQTSIAQQVNLVNTNGLAVNFWDGNGARGDGQVQGGDGVWQNVSGNDNWTVVDGTINAPYQDSSFAIFGAAAGTVTVDASLGAINSSGMQFATDGYRVEGDDIALTGSAPVIRVGDGTTDGAGMSATIASVLTGSDGLTKSDLGTLVLAGDNTYTGGTTIADGVLQLGEGGTSGSIVGDVADNGTLAFDRSDVQTFGGVISGSGAVTQIGSGTTVLAGDNSYTGATTVQGGTLLIDGDQSAANGATTVQSGGTLGGAGTIGGNVTVADGATLSPGAATGTVGTLTVNGNLTLGANSALDYQLGQAGTVGGTTNDLTIVHGNLTLDGTLNVSATPGGSFGPGVYRLFSYDGALTNNGLALGTVPTTDAFVQTSLANQVNLVDTDGLTLSFWDGPGHANDGAITGGTGTWRLADNDYWTDATGSLNAPYSNGTFAVFGGSGGVVTVDNANGQVSASGMQFSADGYQLAGGAITLTGGASSIRVGDGTAAGANMTATIDNMLGGSGMLVKDDLGTLVLNGSNTYAGGTEVHAGSLQISSDANLGDATGSLSVDDGTLHTTASFESNRSVGLGGAATFDTDAGTTLTLDGDVSGSGGLSKSGDGTLVLGGTSSYSGATSVTAGTLSAAMANAFNASSAFAVKSGATLDLGGFSQHVDSLANAGVVNFGKTPGTTLTVQGDYVGQGGLLNFNTVLGGDASATDMLVVAGDTSGNSLVHVTHVGGSGAATPQGIKLIDVKGVSNGSFALQGDYVFQGQQAVIAGAYAYRLYKDGTDTADGDWYLRSALTNPPSDPGDPGNGNNPPPPLYQPGVPLYEAYAGILQQENTMDTLVQRTGSRQWRNGDGSDGMQPGEGVWVRTQGSDRTIKPAYSTSGTHYDTSDWKSEVGLDATLSENGAGKLVGGASLQYGHDNANVHSAYGDGRINSRAYGIGTALTWYGDNGFYVDGQAHWLSFNSDLRSHTLGRLLVDDNHADGYALSAETGQSFHLSDVWSIVPQAQVTYGKTSFDSFNDVYGTGVRQQNGNTGVARAGATLDYLHTRQGAGGAVVTHLYVIANVYNNFQNSAQVSVAGTDFTTRNERWWGGLGVGGAIDWASGRYSIYGEVQAQSGLSHGDSHAMNGTLGFRMRW